MEIDENKPEIAEIKVEKDQEHFMTTSNFKTEVKFIGIIMKLEFKSKFPF